MMNSENESKKIVQSFIDLVNLANWLMDENQQPSVSQELGRLFPSIRGRERRDESSELLRVGAGESSASATDTNNTSFATRSTTKRKTEEIWDQKQHQRNHCVCRMPMSHKTTSGKTPSNFAIFSPVKPSDFRYVTCLMRFLKFDLPRL